MSINQKRAQWAHEALIKFAGECGQSLDDQEDCADAIADLIGDLGHYAETRDIDFHRALERGAGMWHAERRALNGEPLFNDQATLSIYESDAVS